MTDHDLSNKDGHSHEHGGHSHEHGGHSHEHDGHSHEHDGHSHEHVLFVDNEQYDWAKDAITGAELRTLAGIPDSVEIYLHVQGHPDREIQPTTIINLDKHRDPERFSTQSPGSQAG